MNRFTIVSNLAEHSFTVQGNVSATLSQPFNVNGELLAYQSPGMLKISAELLTVGAVSIAVDAGQEEFHPLPETTVLPTYALQNLLLQWNNPTELLISGSLAPVQASDQRSISIAQGTASVHIPIVRLHPVLPDPYASNLEDFPFEVTSEQPVLGELEVSLTWSPSGPVNVSIQLPDVSFEGAVTLPAADDANNPEIVLSSLNKDTFNTGPHSPALLDLSTNASQFGLEYNRGGDPPQVQGLAMQLPAARLSVMAVPAVSWVRYDVKSKQRSCTCADLLAGACIHFLTRTRLPRDIRVCIRQSTSQDSDQVCGTHSCAAQRYARYNQKRLQQRGRRQRCGKIHSSFRYCGVCDLAAPTTTTARALQVTKYDDGRVILPDSEFRKRTTSLPASSNAISSYWIAWKSTNF